MRMKYVYTLVIGTIIDGIVHEYTAGIYRTEKLAKRARKERKKLERSLGNYITVEEWMVHG